MKKYLLSLFLLTGVCSGESLSELIDQAQTAGNYNINQIVRYINAPQGYTTTTVTNSYPKDAALQTNEVAIIAEIIAMGIDTNLVVSQGWDAVIVSLDAAFTAASGNDTQEKAVLRSSLMLLAGYSQYRTLKGGEGAITEDFGSPVVLVVSNPRTPNPSLAQQHLGAAVTREQVKSFL